MKFSVSRKEIKNALDTIKRAVPSRTQLPVLKHVLLHANEQGLRIAATDLEVGAEVTIPASVLRHGAFTVPAVDLAKAVTRPGSDTIGMELEDDGTHVLQVTNGGARLRLPGIPSEDYPSLPAVTPSIALEVPQDAFRTILRRVLPAVSKDEVRPILCGVCVELGQEYLKLCATDTHRLSIATHTIETGVLPTKNGDPRQLVVPASAMALVDRLLTNADEPVGIAFQPEYESCNNGGSEFVNCGYARFTANGYTVVMRLVPGTFPRYQRVIPSRQTSQVTVAAAPFLAAVKAAGALAAAIPKHNNGQNRIFLRCEEERITIVGIDSNGGRAEEVVYAYLEGEAIDVAYNATYLADAITSAGSECVTLGLGPEALSPGSMRPAGTRDAEDLTVLMPMQADVWPFAEREQPAAAAPAAVETQRAEEEAAAEAECDAAWDDPAEAEAVAVHAQVQAEAQAEEDAAEGAAQQQADPVYACEQAITAPERQASAAAAEGADPATLQPTAADAADPVGTLEVLVELHGEWAARYRTRGDAGSAAVAEARASGVLQALAFLHAAQAAGRIQYVSP